MTTLELFKKHRKGEVSRERFLYEVRRDNNLPWVTNTTSYNDAVKILKNKGIIREAQFEPQNIATDPIVDRVNPYALKREVEKLLAKETELTNDSYNQALNKAAKKLQTAAAVKKSMFANAEHIEKKDATLQMQPVKNANHVDKSNGMKKTKGQQVPKATSAPTKENKKTKKPKGVTVMKDKGVEGSEKVIKEISEYLKKKLALVENSAYHDFHEGQKVPSPHGEATVKEIRGGTMVLETEDGKLYDCQMNVVSALMEKQKAHAEEINEFEDFDAIDYDEDSQDSEINYEVGDEVKVVYPNEYEGQIGEVIEFSPEGSFITVQFDDGDTAHMHSSDVEKYEGEDEDDWEDDELDEARDPNDPARISAYQKVDRFKKQPTLAQLMAQQDDDFEIEQEIRALKRERFQLIRDMEQEAEPEGGPIADDYGDRLNVIDQQIADLEAKLRGGSEELEEFTTAKTTDSAHNADVLKRINTKVQNPLAKKDLTTSFNAGNTIDL